MALHSETVFQTSSVCLIRKVINTKAAIGLLDENMFSGIDIGRDSNL